MIRRILRAGAVAWVLLPLACAAPEARATPDGPPPPVAAEAAAFYERYGAALAAGQRERVAGFYHPGGATIVFNGTRWRQSHAARRESYRTEWAPPQFFAWDSLHFETLAASQVLVTGGFRWQAPGQPDTTRFVYAAVLAALDTGLAIVFEHETVRPPP